MRIEVAQGHAWLGWSRGLNGTQGVNHHLMLDCAFNPLPPRPGRPPSDAGLPSFRPWGDSWGGTSRPSSRWPVGLGRDSPPRWLLEITGHLLRGPCVLFPFLWMWVPGAATLTLHSFLRFVSCVEGSRPSKPSVILCRQSKRKQQRGKYHGVKCYRILLTLSWKI